MNMVVLGTKKQKSKTFLQLGKNKMAHKIEMTHPISGIIKDGYIGFSYTYFFLGIFSLGWLVPLTRGNLVIALICLLFHILTLPIWMLTALIFGMYFNKFYTLQLIEDGYKFTDSDKELIIYAKHVLGIKDDRTI